MAVNSMNEDDVELVGMGLRVSVSPVQTAFYIFLVFLGILGNATVVGVIGKSIIMDRGGGRNSDIIIVNMALSNLLVSLLRNTLLILSDIGLEVRPNQVVDFTTVADEKMRVLCSVSQMYSSKDWCQFLMGVWVWLRSVNVWSTLFLSAFHLQTLRRVAPMAVNAPGSRGAPKILLMNLFLIWFINLIYSIPAHVFSTSGNINSTEVRPWNFIYIITYLF